MMRMEGYLALGSNLGDRLRHLQDGLSGLGRAGVEPLALSSVWETSPVDSVSPLKFLNMAARVRSSLEPLELLGLLLELERRSGRVRTARNEPRTLDLDLLMFGELELDHPQLRLPHPRMWERRFVLEPLAEIAPGLRNPATGQTVAQQRVRIRNRGEVRKLGPLATSGALPL